MPNDHQQPTAQPMAPSVTNASSPSSSSSSAPSEHRHHHHEHRRHHHSSSGTGGTSRGFGSSRSSSERNHASRGKRGGSHSEGNRNEHNGSDKVVVYDLPQRHSHHRSRAFAVLGAIFGGLLVAALLLVAAWYCWDREQRIAKLEKEIEVQNELIKAQKDQIAGFVSRLEELSRSVIEE